ncbi:MAG: hypothetical protein ACRC9K_20315 [Afipia sp.]
MANFRARALLALLIGLAVVSSLIQVHAEWWRAYTPKDFEECSQSAGQPGLSKDDQAKIISECDTKFVGRRKTGGGYTYFDFTQNRHFDIAGPNPTQQELKRMDQEYLAYLEANRETSVVAEGAQALAAINNQMKPVIYEKLPQPKVTVKQPVATNNAGVRKNAGCKNDALSCGWAKITTAVVDLREALLGDTRHVQRKL